MTISRFDVCFSVTMALEQTQHTALTRDFSDAADENHVDDAKAFLVDFDDDVYDSDGSFADDDVFGGEDVADAKSDDLGGEDAEDAADDSDDDCDSDDSDDSDDDDIFGGEDVANAKSDDLGGGLPKPRRIVHWEADEDVANAKSDDLGLPKPRRIVHWELGGEDAADDSDDDLGGDLGGEGGADADHWETAAPQTDPEVRSHPMRLRNRAGVALVHLAKSRDAYTAETQPAGWTSTEPRLTYTEVKISSEGLKRIVHTVDAAVHKQYRVGGETVEEDALKNLGLAAAPRVRVAQDALDRMGEFLVDLAYEVGRAAIVYTEAQNHVKMSREDIEHALVHCKYPVYGEPCQGRYIAKNATSASAYTDRKVGESFLLSVKPVSSLFKKVCSRVNPDLSFATDGLLLFQTVAEQQLANYVFQANTLRHIFNGGTLLKSFFDALDRLDASR